MWCTESQMKKSFKEDEATLSNANDKSSNTRIKVYHWG